MSDAWLDVFAGHGVGVALKQLEIPECAVENWQPAIDTRLANGLSEPVYRDAWDVHLAADLTFEGIWLSPPCQTFSVAGKGHGRENLNTVLGMIESRAWDNPTELRTQAEATGDDRTGLVLTPLAYAHAYRPRFLVLEQVPPVLPVWQAMVPHLEGMGYSAWTGILDAADYGVPQNRRRAYLIARRDGGTAKPPSKAEATTLRGIRPDQEGLISNYSSGSGGIIVPGNKKPRGYREIDQPAFTVTGKVSANKWHPSGENVSPREALLMQSYPEDFVIHGDWSLQIGNAVPPSLAKQIIQELKGAQ